MVELLVAVAIFGILVVMAFPTMRAVQSFNEKQKFEEYGKTVVSAAKLYVDAYMDDVFPKGLKNDFSMVSTEELYKKDLIKDIRMSDATCITGLSNVRVVKYNDDITYCLHLTCVSTKNSNLVLYESKNTEGSCKNFSTVIVTYKYDNNKTIREHSEEIIKNDDYRIKSASEVGFDLATDHYVFLGWTPSAYEANKTYKISGNLNLLATYRRFKYNIYFNGGTPPTSGSMDKQECFDSTNCTLKTNAYSKEGHHFLNWRDGNNKTYTDKQTIKLEVPKEDYRIDLTAIWEKNTYKITYNGNGSTSGSTAETSCKYNETCTLATNGFKRNGYSFDGWYTEANGGTKYGSTTTLTSNKTVYAHWKSSDFKPAKPTITNPSKGVWTNKAFNLSISTTSPADKLGKWYIKHGNGAYSELKNDSGKVATGVNSFKSYSFNTDENDTVYVIVCSKNASGSGDSKNCSDAASTNIKIDVTPPVLEKVWGKEHTKKGWSYFYVQFSDTSGLKPIDNKHKNNGIIYYCYDGSVGGCYNICANKPKDKSRTKISDKWYNKAQLDNNLSASLRDTVEMKVDARCGRGQKYNKKKSFTVYLYMKACDSLGNCKEYPTSVELK